MAATKDAKFNPTLAAKTCKAHIEKSVMYDEKSRQHAVSAALILLEAKAALGHGNYMPWLKENDIAPRTASRLIAEHLDPKKREARQTKANAKGKADRAKAKRADEKAKAEAKDPMRTEVLKIVSKLDADGIAAVMGFLVAQGYTETEAEAETEAEDVAAAA